MIFRDDKDLLKENAELKKRCEELNAKVFFLEEKVKNDSNWKDSSFNEINENIKKLKNYQNYISNLEAKLKESSKTILAMKNKLQSADEKLEAAKIYLAKAKAVIENNEITIETYRSMKLSLLQTMKSLYQDEKLSSLSLKYLEMTDDFLPVINKIIKSNPTIETLDLEGNLITDEGIPHICDIISYCTGKLHTINLEFNHISANGAYEILNAISTRDSKIKTSGNNKIAHIKLSYNKFENNNDLYVKVWKFIESNNIDVRAIIDKKHLLTASPSFLAKAFMQISDNCDKPKIKETISALLRVNIEGIKPLQSFQDGNGQLLKTESIIEEFEEYFNEDTEDYEEKNEENKVFVREPKAPASIIDIESMFMQGFKNYTKVIDKLVENNVNINTLDEKLQETLLMYAIRIKNLLLVQYLVKKGAEIDLSNVSGI